MRDPETGWIQLQPGELFVLWSALGLGELPAILGIPRAGLTAQTRTDLVAGTSATLTERGLGTIAEPDRDLEQLLRVLGESATRLDMHAEGDGFSFRAVGAVGRGVAATLGVSWPEVRLGPVRESALVPAMLEVLVPLQAGVGRTANVRVSDYEAACAAGEREGSGGFAAALREAGLRPPEVNTLTRALTERAGGGQFGASVRERGDRWARNPTVLSWLDTAGGRYALRRTGEWVSLTPADPSLLRTMAEELAADVRR